MHYQITAPLIADHEKQADELGRLLRHSRQLTLEFVTVAGAYKPTRACLTLLSVPSRVAAQAERVLALLSGRDDAARPSAPLRPRAEWRYRALLLPSEAAAPTLDGTLLEAWHSARLTLIYRPGRALAWLSYCREDRARAAELRLPGWQVLRPTPLRTLGAGRAWQGVPSFAPVPASPTGARELPRTCPEPAPAAMDLPTTGWPAAAPHESTAVSPQPDPSCAGALADDESGLLLGLVASGGPVRLARRALTMAVSGDVTARRQALLALARHGLQSGMGVVLAVDRALLPQEQLLAWEPRVRLLDARQIADSCALPWRAIAPDLLAQALGGEQAHLAARPSRFADLLDSLGLSGLRVPGLLGLVAPPGDDLRSALAAGGLVVVPQDGDAVSAAVARLLLAYLATPQQTRALLLMLDPELVPPAALRHQSIQLVFGQRSDALLELCRAEAGWQLRSAAGACLAELQPDLALQPGLVTGAQADAIAHAIGDRPKPAASYAEAAGWWDATLAGEPALQADASGEALADLTAGAPLGLPATSASAADDSAPSWLEAERHLPAADTEHAADDDGDLLDAVLSELLSWLLCTVPADAVERQIQVAVRDLEYAQAERLAHAWQAQAREITQPWLWQVVLAEDHAARAAAAARALALEPAGRQAPALRRTLALLGATSTEPIAETPRPSSQAELSDAALRAAWQSGTPTAQLIEQLIASGLAAHAARARVRAVLSQRPAQHLPAEHEASDVNAIETPFMPESAARDVPSPHATNAIETPIMPDPQSHDQLIWQRWQANEPTDTLVQWLSGRRGGPRADAARDQIYAAVIPRIVRQLAADDLLAELAAGRPVAHDPRYLELLQHLARSQQPPMGMLEQSLCRRLIAAYQEGRCGR